MELAKEEEPQNLAAAAAQPMTMTERTKERKVVRPIASPKETEDHTNLQPQGPPDLVERYND